MSPPLADRLQVMRPQMQRLRADVLCLQEVNGQNVGKHRELSALAALIADTPYAEYHLGHTTTADGDPFAERNLVLLSRFPILTLQQIKHDRVAQPIHRKVTADPPEENSPITWERPFLYATLDLGSGRTLHVLNLHLKSKLPSSIPGQKIDRFRWKTVSAWAEGYFISTMKRVGQALEARLVIDEIFDAYAKREGGALIVVCGDFNADSEAVSVNAIRGPVEGTGNADLGSRVMVPCERNIPRSSRYSFFHLGKGQMIDHILASRSLLGYFHQAEIHNEVLPDESAPFLSDKHFPESDHAPVIAEFELP